MQRGPGGGKSRTWLIAASGIVSILVGGFLPWLRSGRAWRNSYELVGTADRLGLVGGGPQRLLAISWYFVPLICGLTLLAIALDRPWLPHLGVALVVAMAAVLVIVTLRSPFPTGWGVWLAGGGAILATVGSAVAAAAQRRRQEMGSAVTHDAGRRRRSAQ